ncbi:MAG: hypothetical protein RLZZ500_938 [Bacteroidota bacterium]|jgi:membrane associated rhomboid family serine protease
MLVLYLLIAMNVLMSYRGFKDRLFFHQYLFHVGSIRAGDQVRMFSSAFLHADMTHLAFNMIALYSFSPVVIAKFGTLTFLLIYAASLVFGSMLSLYMHRDHPSYTAVGASGAVTGIIYASILIEPEGGIYLFFIPFAIPAYIFGFGYLLFTIYGMRAKSDNIGHDAHFGGAIGGLVFTLMKAPELFQLNPLLVIGLVIPIVIMFILLRLGKL